MSNNKPEEKSAKHSPFCKHNRRSVKKTPFVFTEKVLKSVAEKSDRFDTAITLAAEVSRQNLEASVQSLASFHTRHTKSPQAFEITNWIDEQFRSFEYTDCFLHSYDNNSLNLNNVICVKPGQDETAGTIILCGHFDSVIGQSPDNVNLRAPGANDNATGIAVILEVARLLVDVPLRHTIQFACFSGEEQGYLGSKAYAAKISSDDLKLRFLLNLDQIGFPAPNKAIVIEHDSGNTTTANDAGSRELAEMLAYLAQNRLNILTDSATIERSDYMPFESHGYKVIGLYESGNYMYAHTAQDTQEKVDYDYLANMCKAALTAMFI